MYVLHCQDVRIVLSEGGQALDHGKNRVHVEPGLGRGPSWGQGQAWGLGSVCAVTVRAHCQGHAQAQ